MWIVRIALQRPYTFIVLAVLIVMGGVFTIMHTAVDIFPEIRIPIISAVWTYTGLPAEDMANRIISQSERAAPTLVNDIEHTESQSLLGMSNVKYFFQPSVDRNLAMAQLASFSQTVLRSLPTGTQPPVLLNYNASSVPILQLAMTSDVLSESQMFDLGNTYIRTGLSTVKGASLPLPFGGRQRQIQVDIDPAALRAKGLSAQDISNTIGEQNLTVPAGTQKIGSTEYNVKLNSSPQVINELNNLPLSIRAGAGTGASDGGVTYVRDVAYVHDGASPQTNLVRVDGKRAVLMSVVKIGSASTLDVIDGIREALPRIESEMPPTLKVAPTGDQSIFVRAAVSGVIREGIMAAALTGLLILLFLGSWRSALIITISIPLSVLVSIMCLSALGETINLMTLGGLALAVGILVDDATVAIENINSHLEQGKQVEQAILDGAQQIAVPALVSTLAICIVFVPMFLLSGVSKYLFVPMAEAVVFAMLASYVLSRTLIPTLAKYWLRPHAAHTDAGETRGAFGHFQQRVERGFENLREGYRGILAGALAYRGIFAITFALLASLPFLLLPWLGRDFFPSVDAGQIKLQVRGPTGTRIEEMAVLCDKVQDVIRTTLPNNEIANIVDNIGLPYSGINLTYNNSAPIGTASADILISLKPEHGSTREYVRKLRDALNNHFPSTTFAFLPADIVSQILNFGQPAPIDVKITGYDQAGNRDFANRLAQKLRQVPGAVDVRIQQVQNYPQLNVNVDRSNAAQLGLTQREIASDMLITLSGSSQTAPAFWNDPKTGVQYSVVTQVPQYRMTTLPDLYATPISAGNNDGKPQLLANLATISRGAGPAIVSHYNSRPATDIYINVDGTDLGTVATAARAIVEDVQKDLPRGSDIRVMGQVDTMYTSFTGLLFGLVGAIVLIYLLIVVNFQSWLDPFIIITALPSALAGIVSTLFITHTTISVPALIGAIMCMGVATANSILMVSFARERMAAGDDPVTAAVAAGFTRFRPVLMTALAMIIGMVPLALGLGEGGEQNSPLGRATIGGLTFATVATLLFVPVAFAIIHGWVAQRRLEKNFA